MPICVGASQSRGLDRQYGSGLTKRHVGNKLLKIFAIRGGSARLTEVAIQHNDACDWPTQVLRMIFERILSLGTFAMVTNLPHTRLPQVNKGSLLKVSFGDLGRTLIRGVHDNHP
ncbi:hypothetical protein Pla100_37470 [Neorhodopirellula pilleata]|uniref:Uncharacterized protein n=1 Tax=Neorhodopirellula pilleata TaxID=2714738 RepID=A0A5C6A5A7_9BACT|nr:hypothetical protein Pla100_37470 [Neorhodopirellula pilleata]